MAKLYYCSGFETVVVTLIHTSHVSPISCPFLGAKFFSWRQCALI